MSKSFRAQLAAASVFLSSLCLAGCIVACLELPACAGEKSAKPVIGVSVDLAGASPKEASISSLYYEAIENSGGIPILLPPMPRADLLSIMPHLDGVLMIGGADYPPALYGEKPEPATHPMLAERSQFDMILAREALAVPTLPILGICAGCQALNIDSGGSLLQDIPSDKPQSKIAHSSSDGWTKGFNMHVVTFLNDGKLARIYNKTPLAVPTSHHQCVDRVAPGFKIVAETPDGLPEAIERDGARFVIGVQWHPERDFEHNKALFAEFIKQASARHSANDQVAEGAH